MSIPAITIWQPYASLIAVGAKRFETRDWPPWVRYVGSRFAIHASTKRPTPASLYGLTVRETQPMELALGVPLAGFQRLPLGAVVATARLAGAYQVGRYHDAQRTATIAQALRGSPALDSIRLMEGEELFGDYSDGRWLWAFADVKPCTPAIPAKGAQGIWQWDGKDAA